MEIILVKDQCQKYGKGTKKSATFFEGYSIVLACIVW